MKIYCILVLLSLADVLGKKCFKLAAKDAEKPIAPLLNGMANDGTTNNDMGKDSGDAKKEGSAPAPPPPAGGNNPPPPPPPPAGGNNDPPPPPPPPTPPAGGQGDGTCKFDDPAVFGTAPPYNLDNNAVDHEVDNNDPHNKIVDLSKNVKSSNIRSSGHQSSVDASNANMKYRFFGRAINWAEMNCIFQKVGIVDKVGKPFYQKAVAKLNALNAYNPGQSDYQKWLGIYNAFSTAAKLKIVPATSFGDAYAASKVYGKLKRQALDNDAAGIRATIAAEKGDTFGVTDDQLIGLWGSNEHQNLHAIIFGNPAVHNTIHMTSLNDNDGWGDRHGCADAMCGGWNDKGEYPQWNGGDPPAWFENAKGFLTLLGV